MVKSGKKFLFDTNITSSYVFDAGGVSLLPWKTVDAHGSGQIIE